MNLTTQSSEKKTPENTTVALDDFLEFMMLHCPQPRSTPHRHTDTRTLTLIHSRGTGLRGKSFVAEQSQWRSLCEEQGRGAPQQVAFPGWGVLAGSASPQALRAASSTAGGSGDWLHSWSSPRRSWSQAGVLTVASKVPRFQPPEPSHRTSGILGQGTYHPVSQRVEEVETVGENPGWGRWQLAP